jgi:hypothetical protein
MATKNNLWAMLWTLFGYPQSFFLHESRNSITGIWLAVVQHSLKDKNHTPDVGLQIKLLMW